MLIRDFFLLLNNPHLRAESLRRWLIWSALTGLSWAAIGYAGLPVGRIITIEGDAVAILRTTASIGLLSLLVGLVIGAAQKLGLNRWTDPFPTWQLMTALGWAVGMILILLINAFANLGLSALFFGLVVGAAVGTAQWLLLSKRFDQAWNWIPMTILASMSGVLLTSFIERQLLLGLGTSLGLVRGLSSLAAGVGGTVVGLLTGMTLLALLRLHRSSGPDEDAS
jgi:hypothetical protein